MPWRTDWLTFGITDDGWTKPGVTARVRVFAVPGQKGAVTRTLSLGVRAPFDVFERPFEVNSNRHDVRAVAHGNDRVPVTVHVCVPARGFSDVTIRTPESSESFGDARNAAAFQVQRKVGVLFSEIALADEIGPRC
jgi:hypothetical protein